jgi:two-component system, OmpR family, sensor kinase
VTLRTKLALIAAGLTLFGLALGLGITYWSLLGFRLADLDEDNRALAEVILEAALAGTPEAAEGYLVRGAIVSTAQLYRQGRLIWEGGVIDAPSPLDPQRLLAKAGAGTVGSWRVYTLRRDGLTVQVGRSLTALQATLRPYGRVAPFLLLVLSLLSGGLAWLMAGFALRPLAALSRAARRFDEGAEPPTISGSDEAATLAQSFTALLERLRSERRREGQFLAYAAHELRTPISALRASLEAAKLRREPPDMELLSRLHREALRLETFAQNLLALSRAEADEVRAQDLDLADLAGRAYDRFLPLALEGGHDLSLEADPAPARADSRLLEQALNNLLANALRHTPAGQVVIRSGTSSGRPYLEVADSGPGLPQPPGEGLGLRVVKAVARAHRGAVELENERGARIRLLLGGQPSPTSQEAEAALPGKARPQILKALAARPWLGLSRLLTG